MENTAKTFPLDGYADTCIGFGYPMHGADKTDDRALCAECADRLDNDIQDREHALYETPDCPAGGHKLGDRYYDCVTCYGD